MKIIKSLLEISPGENFVIIIGNFDGVHVGHQEIIKNILSYCHKEKFSMVVVTFVPHPLSILRPMDHFLINSYKERREMLGGLGVNYVMEIDFTRDFSTLGPDEFLSKYITINKHLKKVFVGYDFCFGANKSGDFKYIQSYCKDKNIEVDHLGEYVHKSLKVSSTSVRNLVKIGDVETASELLGREFFLCGRVTKGAGRGRQLSYPTANLEYAKEKIVPMSGVYVTSVQIGSNRYRAVTNIGINPTFNADELTKIETHIFDFSDDIYGEQLKIFFHKRLRAEKKFSSVGELVEQIARDVEQSKEYFKCLD